MKATPGKVLYGLLFCAVLPALLWWWAWALEARGPQLPGLLTPGGGWALIGLGGGLMAWGMHDLWRRGGGLPMTAYPPPRYVANGAYAWVAHPIYLGFALLMPGVFAAAGLSAGVWLVSPVIWLGTAALVIGHERIDLRRRFGAERPRPRLGLPPDAAVSPSGWQRVAVYALVLGPWLVAHWSVARLLEGARGTETYFASEYSWAPVPGAAVLYAAAVGWIALAPLVAATQAELRRLVRDGWVGAALLLWCHLVWPLTATPRADGGSLWGDLLPAAAAGPSGWGAFPSAQVVWVLLAARCYAGRLPAPVTHFIAVVLAGSGVMAGQTSLLAVVAGLGLSWGLFRIDAAWRGLLQLTERVANSWRDWRLGPVRLINHGGYVGAAAAVGLWLVGVLLGPDHTGEILLVSGCSLLGAGIWAQWLESSSGLSRPFGYYGGIFGGWVGVLLVQVWRGDGWLLMGAFAVISPLVQGIGRLRCLVQGCCHGGPCADHLGIRYRHPLSRVCKMTRWGGMAVYPTPLYSMLGNVLILGLALRLWFAGAELAFITGVCLILTACARFMEEGYRGEPQTARWGGLAIYQWLALLFVIGGAVATLVPTPAAPAVGGAVAAPLAYALPFGLVVWLAMGVDFPESQRRFSRLA
jgi:protein-S-isoprenylcysteine O-methyltransferase Ste14